MIQPAALGDGLPLFKDLPAPLHLDLIDAKPITAASQFTSIGRGVQSPSEARGGPHS